MINIKRIEIITKIFDHQLSFHFGGLCKLNHTGSVFKAGRVFLSWAVQKAEKLSWFFERPPHSCTKRQKPAKN